LGRNANLVGTARRLEQLEQIPAQALLPALMLGVETDVAPTPEIVQIGALVGEELAKPAVYDPIQTPFRAVAQLVRFVGTRGVVGEVFGQRDRLAWFGVDVKHD